MLCVYVCVQEYLGSYVSDESGRLVFREGLLVQVRAQGRLAQHSK